MTIKPKPKPKRAAEPAPEPEPELAVLEMMAQVFGQVAVLVDGPARDGTWRWVTDGRADPRNQRVGEFFAVQVTYGGKGWIWGHRTESEAREMAESLRKNKVKNVRVWRAGIDWEAL